MIRQTTLWLLTGLLTCSEVARADHSLKSHQPFLKQYCFECHGAKKQKADYRYDTLVTDLTDLHTHQTSRYQHTGHAQQTDLG